MASITSYLRHLLESSENMQRDRNQAPKSLSRRTNLTWSMLKGGAKALVKGGFQAVGAEKAKWASEITPYMNVERNVSPSFRAFRNEIQRLLGT